MPTFYGYTFTMIDSACAYPDHCHQDYEVIFVDAGVYRCTVNGVHLVLQANDLLVVTPGDIHADSFAPPLQCIAIQFRLPHPSLTGLAAELKECGFSGCAVIEYEGDENNPVPALTSCVEAVRKAFGV